MFSKSRDAHYPTNSKLTLVVAAVLCLSAIAMASLMPRSEAASAFGPTLLHFHGSVDDGDAGAPCSGQSPADVQGCGGPFLKGAGPQATAPAAVWHATSALNQDIERSSVDPNWVWKVNGPTTLRGDVNINFWAQCGVCSPGLFEAEWDVTIWADGANVFTQHLVGPTPGTPNVPSLLNATVNIPANITAQDRFVLVIDPVYLDTQENTKVYFDSTLPCPGQTAGPCDSTVTMPVVDPNSGGGPSPTPTPTPASSPTATPTPVPPNTPSYTNYYPPAGTADSWGEPSIGANWITGNIMTYGGLSTYALKASFNDSSSPASVQWKQTPLLTAGLPRAAGDPILVVDKDTGRTFASQLEGLTPTQTMDVSDNDGDTYLPTAGFGIGSGIDHQTIGVGPFHAPVPQGAVYKNAVYYCAQDALNASNNGIANCALSVDGGLTFGPSVPVYVVNAVNSCFPLHGHLKVAPDGTAYLPNRKCGDGAGLVLSEDNGITWQARTIPNSSVGSSDASIGISTDGTIYLGYQAADGSPWIAVSHDKGLTWANHQNVGTQVDVKSGIFPAVVAGDPNRAAFAFYGSSTAGDQDSVDFRGTWYLYISSTFDGGQTWTTVNATPGDPIQRDGICTRGFQGCSVPRNLLDFFDATIDKEGRVLVAYNDGCMGACVQAGPNGNTSKGVIARQSGGRRMFAANDPEPGPSPSPTPTPTVSPTPTPTPTLSGAIPPAAQDNGPKVGFENFTAPGVLLTTLVTSAGQQPNSVEYQGRNAGEPSIGNNWKTGVTAFQTDLQTLFVTFDDSCPTNGQSSTWVNRQAPTSQAVNSDPIGFTDRQTGRTFAGELTLLSPSCKTSFTDDDGLHWTPTQGSGIASGVDHQTIGGGPFAAPLTRPTDVPGVYPNAVYYCSQDTQDDSGFCSRSDDGGLTFGPSVPVSTPAVTGCSGLHGHVKVSPKDGAVYLPVNYCNGVGSVIVSLDNGVTWTAHQVQSAGWQTRPSLSFQDPAVAIDASGRVYYVIADADSAAAVLTSTDHGATWQNLGDVGAAYGLKNVRYPAAIAGDDGRASVAFYGTTTPGDALQPTFDGEWHLYIANTFDGGVTWTTADATPNAPMQRGCIWAKGGANVCRNLLDFFDMTVDRDGRVLVGYVNGCEGGPCAQASHTAKGNAYTAAATIARQSSGRRLIAAKDPLSAMSKPGVPSVTQRRVGDIVHLGWSEADTGNSPITSYKIMRGTTSGGESLLATVAGNVTRYDDTTATDTSKTYYYTVLAVNAVGTSCATNETAAPYVGDTCNGLIIHRNEPTHPEANLGLNTPASLLIDYVAVAEPPGGDNLMLKMKVNSLASIPQNSRWRISWDSFAAEGIDPDAQQFYVGMTTGPSGGPTFEWGTLADAGLPAVYAISETKRGDALAGSGYNADGTITIIIPKSAVGNPQPGDLLGAVNGRTFTADVPGTPESKLERSNLFIDHTFVKAQTDNSYPAATYMIAGNVACSQFIEQNVNSMVALQPSGATTVNGVSSYNMVIKNTSTQTIFAPLRIEVASITSASGRVTVANADNGRSGAGAAWDYSTFIGADNALTAGESSAARSLKFKNPNKESFTVTFNVIGNLARSSQSSSAGGGSSGGDPTATVTNLVYTITYNPLLNSLKSQLIKP